MSQIHQATEREVILAALERNKYNRLATAKELGMHKSTLFRKLKKLKLDLPDIDGRTQGTRTPLSPFE
jgi:transcriptional regulator with PAS, ATPase and Fis domain